MATTHKTRRRGRWTYGNHAGLNPGWRLDGTNLVLDFDPLHSGCSIPGAYVLWRDGRPGDPVDHYLDGAMCWVEEQIGESIMVALGGIGRRAGRR